MRFLPLLTALLVALALYAVILERDALTAFANGAAPEAEEQAAPPPVGSADGPVSVVVMSSRAAPVQSGIVLSGRTEAARKVQIRAETTGLVISEPIAKGTRIASGDTLCELAPGTREASLAEAQARLREAETQLRTSQQLAERGFSAETDTITKQAALQSAQARVEQAQTELDRLTITAPFDGLLETNTAELGELMQPGGACATLISLDPIVLVGFVPEQDIEKLTVGSPAGARLVTGQVLSGQVTFLSRSADEITRTFRVEVQVPNPDRSIRDGVTAEILIGLEGETGHLLPQSALTLNDDGILGVRTAEDGRARFMPVTLIRDDARGVWVGGLPEKADVIVVGQDFVRDGRPIIPTYREASQ
ncbi:efflux RND transporter periplasmic adaptor subunit [Oceanibium sediminis]|uniref:efflux RND transporter periplasmic adaptor subunit n=1 Tax=Oceanibium sediminis TaxID=2026339 RepID=UPI000DD4688E|nr:efflux RND transporter periplasmic adaptor subunit [Oceanibium sediminis]